MLGNSCDNSTNHSGIISIGQIKPEEKISGIELINTTTVTSSLRGTNSPIKIPIKQLASKKGRSKVKICVVEASWFKLMKKTKII